MQYRPLPLNNKTTTSTRHDTATTEKKLQQNTTIQHCYSITLMSAKSQYSNGNPKQTIKQPE